MPLHVHSIFRSISGEVGAIPQGGMCIFIRMQGCNLRCEYCDAPEAQNWGRADTATDVESLIQTWIELSGRSSRLPVVITGGEPLTQPQFLLAALVEGFLRYGAPVVQIETNGTCSPAEFLEELNPTFHSRVNFVIDFKLPGSGGHSDPAAFTNLPAGSWIKFVANAPADLIYTMTLLREWLAADPTVLSRTRIAIGQTENLPKNFLSHWFLENWQDLAPFHAVLNVQIHKLLDME